MRTFIFLILTILWSNLLSAQSAENYFVDAAHLYVNSKSNEALTIVQEGLQTYPDNPKLKALKQKIEEQNQNNQGDSENEGQDSQDGSQKDEEKTENQQNSDQQDGRNQGEEGSGNSDKQSRQQEGEGSDDGNPNNGKDLQEQRYNQILKAIKHQEQNTQRRLMMGKNKSRLSRKQKDW